MTPTATGAPARPDVAERVRALVARARGYVPGWKPGAFGPDAALLQVMARLLDAIGRRLDQVPGKDGLALLDALAVRLIPAQSARAPVVFTLNEKAPDARLPAGARVAAPPPPGGTEQIVFEVEHATGLAAARLAQVASLWPGRDAWIDHSAAVLAGTPFRPFDPLSLVFTPHALYLAHDTLLALSGRCAVDVRVELATGSSEPFDLVWEYWDGTTWREFLGMRPGCDPAEEQKLDGTDGLTRSGRFHLTADCAESGPTAVGGITASWIRARLTQPLPPDPSRVLPEIDALKLHTEIAQPLVLSGTSGELSSSGTAEMLVVSVTDEQGVPLRGVNVSAAGTTMQTDAAGRAAFSPGAGTAHVDVSIGDTHLEQDAPQGTTGVSFQFQAAGLPADKAASDEQTLDVTKPFLPFGPQPQPGDAFYFSCADAFSRPGAALQIYVQTTPTPQDQLTPADTVILLARPRRRRSARADLPFVALAHTVSWEYWNGREWASIAPGFANDPAASPASVAADDFTGTGLVNLTVPDDIAPTQVNGQDGLWMRVRLTSGGYGFTRTVTWAAGAGNFTYVVSQPPALSRFLLGYVWQRGPFAAEHVLTYNDFQYQDHTSEATWPGDTFRPFQPVSDLVPALYLGFDRPLPVDWLGTYFDVEEVAGDVEGPALVWEAFAGGRWEDLRAEDETHRLRLPGMVSFIGAEGAAALSRFGQPLHWVRARLQEDGPPGSPTVDGLFPNAAWAGQHQTTTDEPIGVSEGQPDQVFTFGRIPVLPGEQLAVCELSGPRANTEWRTLATEVLADPERVASLEVLLGGEATQNDVAAGPLRLVRDRLKRVVEVWVTWEGRRDLFASGPNDRHYALDRARGTIFFGDGVNGAIPPSAAAIQALWYQAGGGSTGNVTAKSLTQLLGPIGGIESVTNPIAAEGGADGETVSALAVRGPHSVRHRGRAVVAQDYEAMAREAAAAVAVATALPDRDPSGHARPGWLTLVIVPRTDDPRPWPSFGLREEVRRYVATRADAALVASDQIVVIGPEYVTIDVSATMVPLHPSDAGAADEAARQALQDFLHPLRGGLDGRGWQPGQGVYLADVAQVLARVDGVDMVRDLALLRDGIEQGEFISVAPHHVVVAGELRLAWVEA